MTTVHDMDNFSISANEDDHIWNGDSINILPDNNYNFTGINPLGIAQDGQEIVICNYSDTYTITLKHDDVNSTDGFRFLFTDNADHNLLPFEQVWGVRREVTSRSGWWMQF